MTRFSPQNAEICMTQKFYIYVYMPTVYIYVFYTVLKAYFNISLSLTFMVYE